MWSLGTLSFRETLYRRGLKVGVSSFTSRTDPRTQTERHEDIQIDVLYMRTNKAAGWCSEWKGFSV